MPLNYKVLDGPTKGLRQKTIVKMREEQPKKLLRSMLNIKIKNSK